jgi:hypothetical protein
MHPYLLDEAVRQRVAALFAGRRIRPDATRHRTPGQDKVGWMLIRLGGRLVSCVEPPARPATLRGAR